MRRILFKKCDLVRSTNAARLLSMLFILLITSFIAQAQTEKREISGLVVDQKGEALPNASIYVKGTVVGASAGIDGHFNMSVPIFKDNPTVLVFTFIGFEDKEVILGKAKDLGKVVLKEDINGLDEVTAIAYGNRKQRDIVTSISSVKAGDIADMPSASLDNLLQGKMAGVQVLNQSGAPGGGGTSVNIRGFNSLFVPGSDASGNANGPMTNDGSPLYVVDGTPINSSTSSETGINGLAEIDPSTIESVSVLKDAASAALYGSRAANGVILITTKQGREGKAKINASVTYGVSILPVTSTQTIGKAERDWQIAQAENQVGAGYDFFSRTYIFPNSYNAAYNAGLGANYDLFFGTGNRSGLQSTALQDSLNPFYNNSTNWWKEIFKPSSTVSANVSILGGTDLIKYMVAVGGYSQKGIMPNSNFKRGNFTSNLSVKPLKGFVINSHTYMAYTDRSRLPGGQNGVEQIASQSSPTATSSLIAGSGFVYDYLQSQISTIINKSYSYRLTQSIKGTIDLYKGLQFSSSLALDFSQQNKNSFYPPDVAPGGYVYGYNKNYTAGSISNDITLNNENLLTYDFTYRNDHKFNFLLGQTYLTKEQNSLGGFAWGTGSDYVHYAPSDIPPTFIDNNGNVIASMGYNSSFTKASMLSYLSRATYNYKDKYMLEATVRRDGSSVFGVNNRWAMFPSLAAGWTFSEEPFMKKYYWISRGKLRASWGETGSQFANPYLAQGLLEIQQGASMGEPGLVPLSLMNANLGWEQSDQYDLGLDMSMFDYRLTFKLDYYYKYQSRQIYYIPLAGDVFFKSNEWLNAMETSNQGIDLEFDYDVIRGDKFSWKSTLVLNRNWNKFEKSYTGYDLDKFIIGAPSSRLQVFATDGFITNVNDIPTTYSPNGTVLPLNEGTPAMPYAVGMRKIKDLNGDGRITPDDLIYTGSTFPIADGGFTNIFKYGNFDASVLFTFTIGRDIINQFKYKSISYKNGSLAPLIYNYNNISTWSPDNLDADLPALGTSGAYATSFTPLLDENIEHVSYGRLKKLTLGYKLPSKFVEKMKMQQFRVYGTIENLFLLSNYSGADPETVPIQTGIDDGNGYPLARTFTVGLVASF